MGVNYWNGIAPKKDGTIPLGASAGADFVSSAQFSDMCMEVI